MVCCGDTGREGHATSWGYPLPALPLDSSDGSHPNHPNPGQASETHSHSVASPFSPFLPPPPCAERLDGDVGAEMWVEGWSIAEGQLPPFISGALARRILRCGKSIHFLQAVCGDRKWVQQRALSSAHTAASFATTLKVGALALPRLTFWDHLPLTAFLIGCLPPGAAVQFG